MDINKKWKNYTNIKYEITGSLVGILSESKTSKHFSYIDKICDKLKDR